MIKVPNLRGACWSDQSRIHIPSIFLRNYTNVPSLISRVIGFRLCTPGESYITIPIMRGGSHNNKSWMCKVHWRIREDKILLANSVGFRLCIGGDI